MLFPRPGVAYPEPFDMGEIRETLPREAWPVARACPPAPGLPR